MFYDSILFQQYNHAFLSAYVALFLYMHPPRELLHPSKALTTPRWG